MADVNAENVTDEDISNAGKYLVYAIFIVLSSIIGIIILVGIVVYILEHFGLMHLFKRTK